MQQKVIASAPGRPLSKARIVETHIEAAWRKVDGAMTVEEFTAAAYEAAAAIGLRDRLTARIAAGEIIPGKIIVRCAS